MPDWYNISPTVQNGLLRGCYQCVPFLEKLFKTDQGCVSCKGSPLNHFLNNICQQRALTLRKAHFRLPHPKCGDCHQNVRQCLEKTSVPVENFSQICSDDGRDKNVAELGRFNILWNRSTQSTFMYKMTKITFHTQTNSYKWVLCDERQQVLELHDMYCLSYSNRSTHEISKVTKHCTTSSNIWLEYLVTMTWKSNLPGSNQFCNFLLHSRTKYLPSSSEQLLCERMHALSHQDSIYMTN